MLWMAGEGVCGVQYLSTSLPSRTAPCPWAQPCPWQSVCVCVCPWAWRSSHWIWPDPPHRASFHPSCPPWGPGQCICREGWDPALAGLSWDPGLGHLSSYARTAGPFCLAPQVPWGPHRPPPGRRPFLTVPATLDCGQGLVSTSDSFTDPARSFPSSSPHLCCPLPRQEQASPGATPETLAVSKYRRET